MQHSPSLAQLAPGSTLLVNPYDLDRLGVADGGSVRVTSSRMTLTLAARADDDVPRGAAAMLVNQVGADPSLLVDAGSPVTDLRVETVK